MVQEISNGVEQPVCASKSLKKLYLAAFEIGRDPSYILTKMNAKTPTTFQNLILSLQQYWARQGCVLLQPFDMEVGAGTFHPATFLRAIGPEPWSAAYVQPSRRPTDGRYGENPNRLSTITSSR